MAHFFRLIAALCIAVLPAAAIALSPILEQPTGSCVPANYPKPYANDPAVTSTWVCGWQGLPARDCGWSNVSPTYGWDGGISTGVYNGMCQMPEPTYSCPANSTMVGSGASSSCSCNEGFEEKDGQCRPKNPCPPGQHEEGGACVPDNCKPDEIRVNGLCVKEPDCPDGTTRVNGQCKPNGCEKGKNVGVYETGGADSVEFLCEDKCTVRVSTKYEVSYTNSDGKLVTEYSGDGILTGGSCTGGTGGGGSGPGGGGQPGGGGGGNNSPGGGGGGGGPTAGGGGGSGPTRLPGVKPPEPKPPDNEGNCAAGQTKGADGQCYDSQPKPPDNDGKCPAGYVKAGTSCVPLTPSVGGGGGGGGTGGGNGDGEGDGSAFAGSCMAGFACEGDAVQCAIAREQHRRNCVMFNDPSPESLLYDANKDKTGNQTGDNPNNETVSLAGRIDTSDALGGGSCIPDLNVTVWGQSLTLPFSTICPSLAMLGNLLVAVSMLLAARIVTRG